MIDDNINKEGITSKNVERVLEVLKSSKCNVLGVEENHRVTHQQDNQGRTQEWDEDYHLIVVGRLNDYGKQDCITLMVPLDGDEDPNGYFLLHSYGLYDPKKTKKLYTQELGKIVKTKIKASTKVEMDYLPLDTSKDQEQVDKALLAFFRYASKMGVQVVGVKSNYIECKAPKAKVPSNVIVNLVPIEGQLYKYKFLSGSKIKDQCHTKSLKDLLDWLSPM